MTTWRLEGSAMTVTVASADLALLNALVAVMVIGPEAAGAVNRPAGVTVPALVDQSTEIPNGCTVHCAVSAVAMIEGAQVTEDGDGDGGEINDGVVPLPHPFVAAIRPQQMRATKLTVLNCILLETSRRF
jgi:hypothetical protein